MASEDDFAYRQRADSKQSIGHLLRRLKNRVALSDLELADRARVDGSLLNKVMNGQEHRELPLHAINALINAIVEDKLLATSEAEEQRIDLLAAAATGHVAAWVRRNGAQLSAESEKSLQEAFRPICRSDLLACGDRGAGRPSEGVRTRRIYLEMLGSNISAAAVHECLGANSVVVADGASGQGEDGRLDSQELVWCILWNDDPGRFSELIAQLRGLEGVDHVDSVELPSDPLDPFLSDDNLRAMSCEVRHAE